MAYDKSNLRALEAGIVNAAPRVWLHSEASLAASDFDAANYISNGGDMGMRVGDLVLHCNIATNIWTGHAVLTVSSTKPGAVNLSNGTVIADGSSNSD